jgi:hypothetical protein
MEPEGLLSCSKSPQVVPTLSQISPDHTTASHLRHILILSYPLRLDLPTDHFHSGFSTKILYIFVFTPCTLHALLISSSLSWLLNLYSTKGTIYEAPPYAIFPNLLSLHRSSIKIFFSAPSSQTPTVYVPPLMSETRLHTHTKPQATLLSCKFQFLRF